MSACDDLIFFDDADDWVRIANVTRTASVIAENSHTPISAFDLGVSIDSSYVAVIASTTDKKHTWRYAGELRQTFYFAEGAGSSLLEKVQTEATPLFIEKLQVVEMSKITPGNFGLRYQPPAWFKNCTIRVYRYTGDKLNFVKDTLFDVGNALNINDPVDPDAEKISLRTLYEEIQACCDYFEQEIDQIKQGLGTDFNEVFRQLAEIKAIRVGDASSNRTPAQTIAVSYFTNLL